MNVSEPPINAPEATALAPRIAMAPWAGAQRPPTWADVAMRLVLDGPVYAIIVVAGILAMRGTASTLEAIVAVLAALLSKTWPRPVQVGAHIAIWVLFGAQLADAAGVVGSFP